MSETEQNSWKLKRQQQQQQKQLQQSQRRELILKQLSVEQLKEYDQVHSQFKMEKIALAKQRKLAARERLHAAPILIIDLTFYDLMSEKQLHSLQQQILFCYGVSCRLEKPLRMHLSGYNDEKLHMSKIDGFPEIWEADVSCQELKSNDHLVYLTADADDICEEYDPNVAYIIGGLIDHNKHKYATLKRAQSLGIRTQRLDLRSFVKLKTSQVITVNQIFELMRLAYSKTMREAVTTVVPSRKTDHVEELRSSIEQ